jgi:hypothetical protein
MFFFPRRFWSLVSAFPLSGAPGGVRGWGVMWPDPRVCVFWCACGS